MSEGCIVNAQSEGQTVAPQVEDCTQEDQPVTVASNTEVGDQVSKSLRCRL